MLWRFPSARKHELVKCQSPPASVNSMPAELALRRLLPSERPLRSLDGGCWVRSVCHTRRSTSNSARQTRVWELVRRSFRPSFRRLASVPTSAWVADGFITSITRQDAPQRPQLFQDLQVCAYLFLLPSLCVESSAFGAGKRAATVPAFTTTPRSSLPGSDTRSSRKGIQECAS